jgi:hypothetical protein
MARLQYGSTFTVWLVIRFPSAAGRLSQQLRLQGLAGR